jgi:hypothetical protein
LLHPPYTAWHLSYVALGAAAAPTLYAGRLIAALGAFFLAVGVSAHALDELVDHPLGTRLTRRMLIVLAVLGLAGAVAIGVAGAVTISVLLVPLVAAGVFLVLAYNLELAGGRFHNDAWFALERRLSTPARELRRRTVELTGTQRLAGGETRELDATQLAEPLEAALQSLWPAVVLLAIGMVAVRL